MAEEKKSGTNWLAVILGGCGCFVFAIGVLVVVGYFAVMGLTAEPENAVREFLTAAGSGDVEAAHDFFSSDLKETQPLEVFRALVEQQPELFKVTDMTFTTRSRDMAKVTLSGTVLLENGSEVSAEFVLIEEDETWKLIAYKLAVVD
jgi:hypothetical protein